MITRLAMIRRLRVLAREALALYRVEPVDLRLMSHAHNTLFSVNDVRGGRYLLRLHTLDTLPASAQSARRRVESELWWLRRLRRDLALDLPAPQSTPGGEDTVTLKADGIEGPRLCVLLGWMEGRFLDRGLAPVHLREVGRLTGRLHNHSAALTVPPWFERSRVAKTDGETEERAAGLFRDHWSRAAAETIRETYCRLRQVEQEMGYSPDAFGLIHADIHQTNYLFHRGKVRLIDFDDSGWGNYLYDLAVTLTEIADLPHYPELRAALLAGYREVRPLSQAQVDLIVPLYMLRHAENLTYFLEERDNPARREWRSRIDSGLAILERWLAGT